ncbi:hypothetical protein BX666DRAFT_2120062 [Dichotomocladium elegans]|nr:hypothetical protein BX666DRAFT_2120062 [Dichotomocladium elegans]
MSSKSHVCFLNMRGLSHSASRAKLRTLLPILATHRLPFVLLCESHLDGIQWSAFNHCNHQWQGYCLAMPGSNSKELGLLVQKALCEQFSFEVVPLEGLPSTALLLKILNNIEFRLLLTRAPNQNSLKRAYFTTITQCLKTLDDPSVIVVGDFKCVLDPRDRSTQTTLSSEPGAKELVSLLEVTYGQDAWLRLRRNRDPGFTYVSSSHNHQSRIDRIYLPGLRSTLEVAQRKRACRLNTRIKTLLNRCNKAKAKGLDTAATLEELASAYDSLEALRASSDLSQSYDSMETSSIPTLIMTYVCGGPRNSLTHLDKPITEEEVHRSIFSLKNGKAPGPDGLGIEFYKATADQKVWRSYSSRKETQPCCKIIVLFRYLMWDYEIYSKLLALRLAPAILDRIRPSQTAFLPGHDIGTSIRDVQMTLHYLKATDSPGICLFLDQGVLRSLRGLYRKAQSTFLVNGQACAKFQALLEDNATIRLTLPTAPKMKYTMFAGDTASGARFNTAKTEVLSTGDVGLKPSELPEPAGQRTPRWRIGVPVGCELDFESTWAPTLRKLVASTKALHLSTLSVKGRIMALRTLVLPKALFLARYLYISSSKLHSIESLLAKLIWNDGRSKAAQDILGLPIQEGGLGFHRLSIMIRAIRLREMRSFRLNLDVRWVQIFMYLWKLQVSKGKGIPWASIQNYLVDLWLQTATGLRSMQNCWPQFWIRTHVDWVSSAGPQFSKFTLVALNWDYPLWYTHLTAFGPSRVWSTIRLGIIASLPVYWSEIIFPEGNWRPDAFAKCSAPTKTMFIRVLTRDVSLQTRQSLFWPCRSTSVATAVSIVNGKPLDWGSVTSPYMAYRPMVQSNLALLPSYPNLPQNLAPHHPRAFVHPWCVVWRLPIANSVRLFIWELQEAPP